MSGHPLGARVAALQRSARLPQLTAALARDGEVVAEAAAGVPEPAPDVQFRIGSITKTFTAVLVLQLRDEGRLALEDPLGRHLPGLPAAVADARAGDLLAHVSGLAREPGGDFWEAVPGPDAQGLLGLLPDPARVLPAGSRWHYSNLAYALLGRLVEELRGADLPTVLRERLLGPLGLERTSWLPEPPHAQGWRLHPFADLVEPEPHADTAAMGAAGQLWSTPRDLCRWGAFLLDPDPALLAPATAAQMRRPVVVVDDAWTQAHGLGLQLVRRGERVLAGHGGSMPGFLAGLVVLPGEGLVAAACANAWQVADPVGLCVDAVLDEAGRAPRRPRAWAPSPVPDAVRELLGEWYYRGAPVRLVCREGLLVLDSGRRRERFEPAGPDLFRGLDAWQGGEPLRVRRGDDGRPAVLDLATWLLVRDPEDPRGLP
ncbi:serine hydrolase domain-containing protein [Vallicoccus soli]|uniref:serine hydrolase domain-containing protein n=1 Tax=Vallicoccus soli TaxID=2339232 RepID=UPI001402125F|nr:serine hydrolase domain-containing protein [Vallicoccus soli]